MREAEGTGIHLGVQGPGVRGDPEDNHRRRPAARGEPTLTAALANPREFYEREYLKLHPDLDAGDIGRKVEALDRLLGGREFGAIAEVGCGSALVLDGIGALTRARRTIGLDLSRAHLRRARGNTPSNQYVQGDAQALPLRSLDLLLAVDVVEHLQGPHRFLREAARIGCALGLYIPLESGLLSDLAYRAMRLLGRSTNLERYGHLHRFTRSAVLTLVRDCGLWVEGSLMVPPPKSAYASLFGRLYARVSRALLQLHPRAHEFIFGGWAMALILRGGPPPGLRVPTTGIRPENNP